MESTLVVGGTGMLAGATRWLGARSDLLLLAARRASGFLPGNARIVPLDIDWNSSFFHEALERGLRNASSVQTSLIWLHDPGAILPRLLPLLGASRIVLVLGTGHELHDLPLADGRIVTVRLGSMPTSTGLRWLTHDEISAGAIAALRDGQSRIVGELASA